MSGMRKTLKMCYPNLVRAYIRKCDRRRDAGGFGPTPWGKTPGPFKVTVGQQRGRAFAANSTSTFIDEDGLEGLRVCGSDVNLEGPKDLWVMDGHIWIGKRYIQAWRCMKDGVFQDGWYVEARTGNSPETQRGQNPTGGKVPARRYKRWPKTHYRAMIYNIPRDVDTELITLYLLPVETFNDNSRDNSQTVRHTRRPAWRI